MNTTDEKANPWWRFGFWGKLGIVLLLALNVGFLTGFFKLDPWYLAWTVNSLDPRLWPMWVVYLFWGTALWLAVDLPRWPKSAIGAKQIVKPILILLMLGAICYFNGWHAPQTRRIFYYQYYYPIIVGPYSKFMVDGTWNWKMLIVPTAATIALVYLIRLFFMLRKKNSTNGISS